jgi:hypothetical protein
MIEAFLFPIGDFIDDLFRHGGHGIHAGEAAGHGFEAQGIEIGWPGVLTLVIIAVVLITIVERLR